jgi:hypothetical protein
VGARLREPAMEPAVNNCQFTYPRETARRRADDSVLKGEASREMTP